MIGDEEDYVSETPRASTADAGVIAVIGATGQQGGATARALLNAGAGVGVGTLYRRYPSRDALLEALTLRSFQLLVALAEEAEVREGDALARWPGATGHSSAFAQIMKGARRDLPRLR